jgi:hypothetical protein
MALCKGSGEQNLHSDINYLAETSFPLGNDQCFHFDTTPFPFGNDIASAWKQSTRCGNIKIFLAVGATGA